MDKTRMTKWKRRARGQVKAGVLSLATLLSPRLNTQLNFFLAFRRFANLDPPRTFAEKISWLKLYRYRNDSLVIRCADKFAVRGYVEEAGLGHLLNELIGVYHSPKEIPWAELPNEFVLKWNFGAGYNCIFPSKEAERIGQAARDLERWGRKRYWLLHSELQYKTADPCILCERFLNPAPQPDLLDYKFYCFHGEPKAVLVIDRGQEQKKGVFMTLEWERLADIPHKYAPFLPSKPSSLPVMTAAARALSRPFPFVRVDFYEWRGQAVFGEMTFTPGAGIFPSEAQIDGRAMGEYISI